MCCAQAWGAPQEVLEAPSTWQFSDALSDSEDDLDSGLSDSDDDDGDDDPFEELEQVRSLSTPGLFKKVMLLGLHFCPRAPNVGRVDPF